MTPTQVSENDCWFERLYNDTMNRIFSRSRLKDVYLAVIVTIILLSFLWILGIHIYAAVTGSYMAGHHSVLLINCPTEQTARDIARYVMEKRMAACVNIFPRMSTMYYLKGEIRHATEVLLLVRTRTSQVQKVVSYLIEIHPYENPEIISFPVEDGSLPYMKWIDEAVPDV